MANRINLTGRLTKDPELRELPDGTPVCDIRLAVDGMGRGGRDQPGYINVSQFGAPGAAAANTLTRGWLVAVDGRIEHRTWETDEGQSRHDYAVIGHIEFLAAPRDQPDADSLTEHQAVA